MTSKNCMAFLVSTGITLMIGCQHAAPTKSFACEDVEREAKASQGLMDWASNDGQADVDRSARAEVKDSSNDPGLKYDCAASAKSASTLKGKGD